LQDKQIVFTKETSSLLDPSYAHCRRLIFVCQIKENTGMNRSDEIQGLASRMGAHAASLVIQGHPGLTKDFGAAAVLLREYARDMRAREDAESRNTGRDTGRELAELLVEGGVTAPLP
jgi:hypothetical protein